MPLCGRCWRIHAIQIIVRPFFTQRLSLCSEPKGVLTHQDQGAAASNYHHWCVDVVLQSDVWIYYAAELKANPSSITLEQKNQLLALYMLRSKMGTISNNTIRAKKNGIIEVIEMWSNKGYLQLPNFKETFEAMFK